jgi:hypothetical protein
VAEWSKAAVCKTVKPPVQIRPLPPNLKFNMLKDYLVLDDIFEDPFSIAEKAKKLEYNVSSDCTHKIQEYGHLNLRKNYLNNSDYLTGNWRGFRTQMLHKTDEELFQKITNEIFAKTLNIHRLVRYEYNVLAQFFIIPNGLKFEESWMHTDPTIFAGVVYLNENPGKNAGTILQLGEERKVIENKFNRLLMYNSKIRHAPQNSFHEDIEDRLVLTFFVQHLRMGYIPH